MTSPFGPISARLESDLRSSVRSNGIVVWLDLDGHYTEFVDGLIELRKSERLPYQVCAWRGSHLELMLALEPLAGGVEKTPLVVHLPGFNEESIRDTPLLALYSAGVRYRKGLDRLVTEAASGQVRPERIEAFRAQGGLTLESADAWLSALLHDDQGGLAGQLRNLPPTALLDDLLSQGLVAKQLGSSQDQDAVWARLAALTGLPDQWREDSLPAGAPRAKDVAFTAASWALCVEYVDDLTRPPIGLRLQPINALPKPLMDTCSQVAEHLRTRHADFYRSSAAETELWLADEVEAAQAKDLGKIDTFRFEEEMVLRAALEALAKQQWADALEWAGLRAADRSFWLRDDPSRRSAWHLVDDAAKLGRAISAAGSTLGVVASLDAAVDRYVERGAAVDQAHRHLEQRRQALLYPQVPEFETLRSLLDGLRKLWRQWADGWARQFNTLCKDYGFLPSSSVQQRTLFDDVVRPMTKEPGPAALFLVDALRFEMGQELRQSVGDPPATALHLRARLAELPTVTAVGMNVLAPVAEAGRLRPALSKGGILGFSSGEFRVSNDKSRNRAMFDRVGGATCPWLTLNDVISRDATSLKQAVVRARLVVVYCREIDDAGEKGAGPAVFDQVLQKLRAAWRLLRDAGVRRFTFTADHGFLLLDESARHAQSHGRKIDPKRRHVFSTVAADHSGEVRVPLRELGYEGENRQLMFPDSTAVFDTGRRSMSFVHGGNSLQERVIPVLTMVHRAAAGSSTLRYSITAQPRRGVAGMHCLSVRVENVAQRALDFGGSDEVELGLRVSDASDVQVELCETRGGRMLAGAVAATVGEEFEVFFRLSGATDARVRLELYPSAADAHVTPCLVEGRFDVTAPRTASEAGSVSQEPADGREWIEELPAGGTRQIFQHLAAHGTVTETEAAAMLGSQRAFRRFAVQFEKFAAKAPFAVRIDVVAGVKRYVREGSIG